MLGQDQKEKLGALLERLCKDAIKLGEGNNPVFEVNTSHLTAAFPQFRFLTPLPSVAVKKLTNPSAGWFELMTQEWRDTMLRVQREWEEQQHLNHENVVQFYAVGSTAEHT